MDQERKHQRMWIVIVVAVALAALAAAAAAAGLAACVAWAGEAVPVPATVGVGETPAPPPAPAASPATPATPRRPGLPERAPHAPLPPMPPMPEEVSARGWFGMAFTCSQCTIQARKGDSPPVWDFAEPPEVYRVEPGGPAEKAGIMPGDVLLEIDGLALDSDAGGRRFGAVNPGEKVRWTVRRGDARRSIVAIAGERPGPSADRATQLARLGEQLAHMRELQDMDQMHTEIERARAQLMRLQVERGEGRERTVRMRNVARPVRYVGTVGGCSNVEVRSFSPVNVTVSQDGDELVITTGESTVRVKVGGK